MVFTPPKTVFPALLCCCHTRSSEVPAAFPLLQGSGSGLGSWSGISNCAGVPPCSFKNRLDPFFGNPVSEKVRHAANENVRGLLFLRRVSQAVFVEGRGKSGRERKNGAVVVLEGCSRM